MASSRRKPAQKKDAPAKDEPTENQDAESTEGEGRTPAEAAAEDTEAGAPKTVVEASEADAPSGDTTPAQEGGLTPSGSDSDGDGDGGGSLYPPEAGTTTPDDAGQTLDGANDPLRAPDGEQAAAAQHFDGAGNKTTDAGAGEIDAALDARPTPSSAPLDAEPGSTVDPPEGGEPVTNGPGLTIHNAHDPAGVVKSDGYLVDAATGEAPDPDTMFVYHGSQATATVRLLESVVVSPVTTTQRLVMPIGKTVPMTLAQALVTRVREADK